MRKVLLISGAVVGGLLLILIGLVAYAVTNLNGILKVERGFVLAKVADSVGREVAAIELKGSVGWGVKLSITGFKIGDDPNFSQLPFVQANEVAGQVDFIPLLFGRINITSLVLKHPEVRIIRDRTGKLNIATLGASKSGAPNPPAEAENKPSKPGTLSSLAITSLKIENGVIYYADAQAGGPPITVGNVDLDVENFNATSPFDVKLGLAVFSNEQNISISGRVGPLMKQGVMDTTELPFTLQANVGPLVVDELRRIPAIGEHIPRQLVLRDPLSVKAKLEGNPQALSFVIDSDMTDARVAYVGSLDKPKGTTLKLSAFGSRKGSDLNIQQANLEIGDMKAKAGQIEFGGDVTHARIDTNRFDIAALGRTVVALAQYKPSGKAEVHADVRVVAKKPQIAGTLTLADAAVQIPRPNVPPLSGITGTIEMNGNSAIVQPTSFTVGTTHGKIEARAESIEPLRATYVLNADVVDVAKFVPNQPANRVEQLVRPSISGTVAGPLSTPEVTARVNTDFVVGSSHGQLQARADSIKPLRASYTVKADVIKIGEFVASRPPDRVEELIEPSVTGTAMGEMNDPNINAQVVSRFSVGSSHGDLSARINSTKPLQATYVVRADTVKLREFVASRPADMDEQLKQIALNGTAAGSTSAPEVSANLSSAEGMVADVPYRNLALTGNYGRQHASLRSLKLEAFGGAISGVADATLGAAPVFNGVLNTTNIDLQQALTAQKSKAADLVRGRLTSQFKVAGRGSNFEEIKPTLQGNGHIGIADGKLVGLNVVAEALNKINGIPGIDTLITPAVVERHPHVFKDPDTDLRVVDMSLLLNGPKITSHDIHVESVDYKLLGDGWFDMDKNIDLSAHVMMSRQFSDDLRSEKKNVVYLTNQQGEIDIPLIIKGQLPKPSVVPDVQFLVQRAATHAVQQQGTKLINKFLEKKGLGGLLPPGGEGMPEGGPPPNAGGPGGAPPPAAGGPPGGPAPGASGTPVNPFEAFGKMLGGKKPSGESPPGQPPGEPPGPGANPTSSANPLAPLQQLFH